MIPLTEIFRIGKFIVRLPRTGEVENGSYWVMSTECLVEVEGFVIDSCDGNTT